MIFRGPFTAHGRGAKLVQSFFDKPIVLAGDSLTQTAGGGGGMWGRSLARSPVSVTYNAAAWGSTIQGRWAAWATDVAAKNPALVMVRLGTNNLGPGTPVDDTAFRDNYQPIIDWFVSNGVPGIIHAVPPESGTSGAIIASQNAWLAAQCAAHPGILYFADDSQGMADGSYDLLAGYTVDGTHMNGLGKRVQGVAMAPLLESIFGTANILILDATDTYEQNATSKQYVRNPLLSGSGGSFLYGATGVMPDHWIGSGGAVFSAVAANGGDTNVNPWLRINPTSGSSESMIYAFGDMSHPEITTDRVEAMLEMRFVGFDTTNFSYVSVQIDHSWSAPFDAGRLDMVGMTETLNETLVVRYGLQQITPVEILANSLRVMVEIGSEDVYSTSQGYIDIRCVSAIGRSD